MVDVDVESEALWRPRYRGIDPFRASAIVADLVATYLFTRVRIREEFTGETLSVLVTAKQWDNLALGE